MVKKQNTIEEKEDNALTKLETSLNEISKKVDHANMKLDHLIETYRKDKYAKACNWPYDLVNEYRYE